MKLVAKGSRLGKSINTGGTAMPNYDGVNAKMKRAEQHLADFEAVLGPWVGAKPVSFVSRPLANGSGEELLVHIDPPMPQELDLILGDCIHNLRSVLDHLAMTLAIANGADPYDRSISFPVFDEETNYRANGVRSIRTLTTAAQAFIEEQQPFKRSTNAWMLTELQSLDNRDKHRSLIAHEPTQIAAFDDPAGVKTTYAAAPRIEEGALFATVTYEASYTGPRGVQPLVPLAVTVERSNRIGFIEVQPFLRDQLLPYIANNIVGEAMRQFP
jgi:hypothetical protein